MVVIFEPVSGAPFDMGLTPETRDTLAACLATIPAGIHAEMAAPTLWRLRQHASRGILNTACDRHLGIPG